MATKTMQTLKQHFSCIATNLVISHYKHISLLLIFILSAFITACSTPGTFMGHEDMKRPFKSHGLTVYPTFIPVTPDLLACHPQANHEYRIGSQDILTIIVWNHPELTIPSMQTTSENVNIYTSLNQSSNNPPGILVNEKGNIFFPLAGLIQVNRLTVAQIREHLTTRLRKYIRNPQVSVRVAAFRNKPVYILGEVMKTGIQYITDMPLTVIDAINQAGGIDRENSDPHFIYVIRGNFAKPTIFWLDASSPSGVLMMTSFRLQSRDVLMVSTAGVARYARLINRILPTIQTVTNQPIRTKDY